jgi:hypothetical protein
MTIIAVHKKQVWIIKLAAKANKEELMKKL